MRDDFESAPSASELPEGMRLPLLTDGTRSLGMGGTPKELGKIEGFLVIECAFWSSLVTLEEIDWA